MRRFVPRAVGVRPMLPVREAKRQPEPSDQLLTRALSWEASMSWREAPPPLAPGAHGAALSYRTLLITVGGAGVSSSGALPGPTLAVICGAEGCSRVRVSPSV